MAFRVTQFQTDQQFLFQHRIAREEESRILERLSTLKRVNRASDDPNNYGRISDSKNQLSETSAYREVMQATMERFTQTETALSGIRNAIDDARELVVGGVSITNTDLERETVADQIAQLRLTIINRLNTTHEGEYIFSGTLTNVQPFQDPVTGNYSGNAELLQIRTSATDNLTTNWTGDAIAYGPGGQGSADDILDALADLETAFRNNDLVTINAELPRLEPIDERINQLISQVGTRTTRLIAEDNHYEQFEIGLQAVLAELEDADLAEEALNLEQSRNTIDAQLRTQGSVSRQSLLDFLS
ncbi:MAG: hypothetical protein QNK37_02245 [Acidobacteriota bacterium]|nr:hypothetical protein [Acidobacteriota bacterium]